MQTITINKFKLHTTHKVNNHPLKTTKFNKVCKQLPNNVAIKSQSNIKPKTKTNLTNVQYQILLKQVTYKTIDKTKTTTNKTTNLKHKSKNKTIIKSKYNKTQNK